MGIDRVKYFGADPSPTGTAIAIFSNGNLEKVYFCTKYKTMAKKYKQAKLVEKVKIGDELGRLNRLNMVSLWFKKILLAEKPSYVALEDYLAFFKSGMVGISQCELGGALRLIVANRVQLRTYTPADVKLAHTGNSKADKSLMIEKADLEIKKMGLENLKEKDLANVADAIAVGNLFWVEYQVRHGQHEVRKLPENLIHVFNRVTDFHPFCLLDRPFIKFEK